MANEYVNQLEKEDFIELFNRIKLFIEYQGRIIPVDYAIQTPTQRFKLENSKPYLTLFLRDFSCSVGKAEEKVKTDIKRIYRNFMLERFEETNYAEDSVAYDEKQKERALNKLNKNNL